MRGSLQLAKKRKEEEGREERRREKKERKGHGYARASFSFFPDDRKEEKEVRSDWGAQPSAAKTREKRMAARDKERQRGEGGMGERKTERQKDRDRERSRETEKVEKDMRGCVLFGSLLFT